MENIAPILVFIVFIVLSLLGKKKPGQSVPQGKPEESQKPQPKPVDFERTFEDYFGETFEEFLGEEKEQNQFEGDEQVVLREPTAIERAFEEKGYEYESFEPEQLENDVFQRYLNKTEVGDDYQFSASSLPASYVSSNQESFQDSGSSEIETENGFGEILDSIDEFSPRDAIIYSEIINRKY